MSSHSCLTLATAAVAADDSRILELNRVALKIAAGPIREFVELHSAGLGKRVWASQKKSAKLVMRQSSNMPVKSPFLRSLELRLRRRQCGKP
ncbi:hypothetical protein BJX61DRAFT_107586 [Aspergillus egyptiacus]|nr:hypothetical protein BJX61DRAFT_107586 [Aspergillus egyptiacus]